MLKVILIDDEPNSIKATKTIIQNIAPSIEILATFTDPLKGLEAIKSTDFDLLLLDIEMPNLSGIELLHKLEDINFEVIFVTAYQNYAVQAIKLSALDYILKPVSPSKLAIALEEAKEKLKEKRELKRRLEILDELLNEKEQEDLMKSQEKRVVFSSQKDINFVQIKNIIRIESAKNYTSFFLKSAKEIVESKNMGFYSDLYTPFNFMKIHRSHIINLYHVIRYLREGYVEMINGDKVPCAGPYKEELLQRLREL